MNLQQSIQSLQPSCESCKLTSRWALALLIWSNCCNAFTKLALKATQIIINAVQDLKGTGKSNQYPTPETGWIVWIVNPISQKQEEHQSNSQKVKLKKQAGCLFWKRTVKRLVQNYGAAQKKHLAENCRTADSVNPAAFILSWCPSWVLQCFVSYLLSQSLLLQV